MSNSMHALRSYQIKTLAYVLTIRQLADAVGFAPVDEILRDLDEVEAFLKEHLVPRVIAEERVLYPEVALIDGAAGTTRPMIFDYVELVRLVEELREIRLWINRGPFSESHQRVMCRILYGIIAVIRLHIVKVEEVYLPLLEDHLAEPEQIALIKRWERVAERAVA